MILDMSGKQLRREPIEGEKPGIGTKFLINGHAFRIVYVKHGKNKEYERFTAELVK
jgi:hypothetical protein